MPTTTTAPVRLSTGTLRAQARGLTLAPLPTGGAERWALAWIAVAAALALLAVGVALPTRSVQPPSGSPPGAPLTAPVQGEVVDAAMPASSESLAQTGSPRVGVAVSTRAATTARRATTSCSAPCSTGQTVRVTIRAGRLTLEAPPRAVLATVDALGAARGRLTGLRVRDLRGASGGWTLSTRVVAVLDARSGAAVPDASVEIAPSCERTAGPLTLRSTDTAVAAVGATVPLCVVPIASAGSLAGGLVSAYADIAVRGAPRGTPLRIEFDTTLS